MKILNVYVNIAIIFCLFIVKNSLGAVDPTISWEVIQTPHFEVIHDSNHYETARRYALRLELNYKSLSQYFTAFPEKTTVILNDNTDLSNGYATYIPYPHMMIYPVLPDSNDSISEYGDWAHELTLHEYTHILNFEPANGVMTLFRKGLGTIGTPTMFLPRWWHEGIAVEMETRYSNHGRLRSIYQDSALRALTKNQQLQNYSIAEINETDISSWPRGAHPYLFGSLLLSQIQSQKQEPIHNTLLQRFSRRLPYLFNAPTEEETGKDFVTWFEEAKSEIHHRAEDQLSQIQKTPVNEFTIFTSQTLESQNPEISPNGRFLAFIAKNHWGKSSLNLYDRGENGRPFQWSSDSFSQFTDPTKGLPNSSNNRNDDDGPPSGNIQSLAWMPDSAGVVFAQVENTSPYSTFSDLHLFDLSTKKIKHLTSGKRLREPTISPKGEWIAAVQLEQTNSKLIRFPIEGSKSSDPIEPGPKENPSRSNEAPLEVLYSAPPFHRISSPLFVSDEIILFSERDKLGQQTPYRFNLQTKSLEPLKLPLEQVNDFDQSERTITFTAVENGMKNLYGSDDDLKTFNRLTHTDTAIFGGHIDRRTNSVYVTQMTSQGLAVASTPLPTEPLKESPTKIEPLLSDRYKTPPTPLSEEALESEFGPSLLSHQPYTTGKYLLPKYWLPFVYVTANGYGTQVSTSSFDPLAKHTYALQAGYDSFAREASVGLNYLNNSTEWPTMIGVGAIERNPPFLSSSFSAQQLSLLTTHDLRPWNKNITLGGGLLAMILSSHANSSISGSTYKQERFGPQIYLDYDTTSSSSYSMLPFSGTKITLTGHHAIKTETLSNLTKGFLSSSYFYSKNLPKGHIALANLKMQEMEGKIRWADYSQSDSFHITQSFNSSRFALRGYDPGYFYFKSARELTLEYHIPVSGPRGWLTLPAFLRQSRLAIYGEALTTDGYAIDYHAQEFKRVNHRSLFQSYGIELKGDATFGYYYPVTFVFGIYHRPDYSGPQKTTTFIGFQI